MTRKNLKNLPKDDFITIFNSSDNYAEIMARTGLTLQYIHYRASQLRKSGVNLKRFQYGKKIGVRGWLKEKYPYVYQDLKDNHPDIFSAYYE